MADATISWVRRDRPEQERVALPDDRGPLLVGRSPTAHVRVAGDAAVSRTHALLTPQNGAWLVEDLGSRGGTFLLRDTERRRLDGRVGLHHGDELLVGRTTLRFRAPVLPGGEDELTVLTEPLVATLTRRERDVLAALCGPGWPTDAEIAAALVVSVETVRSHLGSLYGKFGLKPLPDRAKRPALVRRALEEGHVRRTDERDR